MIQEGEGVEVAEHSSPLIHYRGTYLDGTAFGSTAESGGPISLPLDGTIEGFAKAVVGMKEGEKRRIYIHPDLAYGTRGHLDPNALLTFEVEIVQTEQVAVEDSEVQDIETEQLALEETAEEDTLEIATESTGTTITEPVAEMPFQATDEETELAEVDAPSPAPAPFEEMTAEIITEESEGAI